MTATGAGLQAGTTPEHREVAGWASGDGTRGFECACGTTYDGIAPADLAAVRAQHLAPVDDEGEEPRCPTCGELLALIASGAVGHGGDEHGYDCLPTPTDGCSCEDCDDLRAGTTRDDEPQQSTASGDLSQTPPGRHPNPVLERQRELFGPTQGEQSIARARAAADTQRAEYVAGLRALADVLEANPELELPYTGRGARRQHTPMDGDQRWPTT